jgi:hypothetical protein
VFHRCHVWLGLLVFSAAHPAFRGTQAEKHVRIEASGIILSAAHTPGTERPPILIGGLFDISMCQKYHNPYCFICVINLGGEEATCLTIVAQVDVQGTLQRMLRGAYKSGLLKIGIRSGFQHICQHLRQQMELFDM